MPEPKRHHLVPRCYLKKFGTNQKKEWYVNAYDKTQENEIFRVNVKNICVETEYYTFANASEEKKRFLEKFYANTIESDYEEVYHLLVNTTETKLSDRQKFAIIRFIVSQHLRTSKLTNVFNKFWNTTLEKGFRLMDFEKGNTKIHFEGGGTIDFKDKTLEEVKKEQEQQNKEYINISNLDRIYELTKRRLKDGIAVKKIDTSFKLITSDNPVNFGKFIYDPNTFIRMPLNESHLLMIVPFNEENYFDPKTISRDILGEEETWMEGCFNNIFQIENSERYIIGSKNNLEDALSFFNNLNEDEFVEKCKAISEKAQRQLAIVEKIFGTK